MAFLLFYGPMKNPFISIIIPIFNIGRYLSRCLDSILDQSFTDFEIVLVNDGSTDSSAHICKDYALRDKRIRVLHKGNGGVSSARNMGLEHCSGKYVWFVDGDDYINSGSLEILKKWADTYSNVDLFIFSSVRSFSTDRITIEIPPECVEGKAYMCGQRNEFRLLYELYIVGAWNACYRGDFVRQFRFENFRLGEDILFSMEALYIADVIVILPASLYIYYQREDSAVHQISWQFYMDYLEYCCRVVSLDSARRDWIADQLFRRYKNKVFGEAMVFASKLPVVDRKRARDLWYEKAEFFLSYFEKQKWFSWAFNLSRKRKTYWLGRVFYELPFRFKSMINKWSLFSTLWSKFRLKNVNK